MHTTQTEVVLSHGDTELVRMILPPGEYILGRGMDATIRAETPLISRRHARLVIEDDHIILEDLESSNGTTVAGMPISEPTVVQHGYEIRLGDVLLEVQRHLGPTDTTQSVMRGGPPMRRFVPSEFLREQRYSIGKIVARGGQGAILDAHETTTQRTVAMKVMLEGQEEADVLRFIEEAQVTAQLEHPNIVPVHELGMDDREQLYYTMKFVRGITLKKVLELMAQGMEATVKKYPLPVLLTIFQKVCDAMAFSHSKGVIHRDLKPENVMLGDYGEVLVMDWGLAKVIGRTEQVASTTTTRGAVLSARVGEGQFGSTLAGSVMGTPYYMSPEQAAGDVERLDQRSDIYSLGAVLFEMLYLRYIVSGATLEEVVGNARDGAIAWPDPHHTQKARTVSHLPGGRAPESLLAVCRKALAFDPAQRYQRVEELQADIDAYLHGFATSAEKTSPLKNLWLLLQRRKIEATAAALVLLSVGWFGTHAFLAGRRASKALAELKQTAPELLRLAANDADFQNYASAQKQIEAALSIDPTLKDGHWRRAWVLLAQEKYGDAAEAIRLAQKKDPQRAAYARILPQVEKLAAGGDETRNDMGLIATIFNHLRVVGASGESGAFVRRLKLTTSERMEMVRKRVEAWVGKDGFSTSITPTGFLEVRLKPGAASNLDGLRGVPLDILEATRCQIATLEPLRGMKLGKVVLDNNPISDLSPLAGMSLFELNISSTSVSDLTPIKGAPLDIFAANSSLINDIGPLRGAPLQRIAVGGSRITDFSPLAGAPLKDVGIGGTRVSSLKFLEQAPVEILTMGSCPNVMDLSPLRGRPLSRLEMGGSNVTDLSPLRGLPIKSLNIDNCKKVTDFTPLLDLPKLERFSCTGVPQALPVMRKHPTLKVIIYQFPGETNAIDRPVAEFWARYDAAAK